MHLVGTMNPAETLLLQWLIHYELELKTKTQLTQSVLARLLMHVFRREFMCEINLQMYNIENWLVWCTLIIF